MAKQLQYQAHSAPVLTPDPDVPELSWYVPFALPRLVHLPRRPEYERFWFQQIDSADFTTPPDSPEHAWHVPFAQPPRLWEKPRLPAELVEFHVRPLSSDTFGTDDHELQWYRQFADPVDLTDRRRRQPEYEQFGETQIQSSDFAGEPTQSWWLAWVEVPHHRRLGVQHQPFGAATPYFHPQGGDSLKFWLSGAASDGAAQTDPDAALGNFRSATEASRTGLLYTQAIANLTIGQASRENGTDGAAGSIQAISDNVIRYTAPGGTPGTAVDITENNSARTVADGSDPSKWVRVTRTSTAALSGRTAFMFHDQLQNLFGMAEAADAESGSGGDRYRACIVRNHGLAVIQTLRLFVAPLVATGVASISGQLSASGAGTITGAAGVFCSFPSTGWARIETSAGVLREIVYYSSRTDTALTVPAGGRARLGTSAAAGAATDLVYAVPGVRVAWEWASPRAEGSVQTIASESTAPTGLTWTTGRTATGGTLIGDMHTHEQGAIWIHRELIAGTTASAKVANYIGVQWRWEGVTFTETLAGLYRIADDDIALYELHHNAGSAPDITGTPDETFTTLPYTTTLTLSVSTTNYFVTQYRNAYNLVSQRRDFAIITVDASGDQQTNAPTDPSDIRIDAAASGAFRIRAVYYYEQDSSTIQADSFRYYFTSNGTDPDPDTDTPTDVALVKVDGAAVLDVTTATFAGGTTGKVIVRTLRTSDSVESTGTTVYSATADATAAGTPTGGLFWRSVAEDSQA